MPALDYLRRAGLAVEANGDRLRLRPADRITDAVRQFVRDHRAELLADLRAANDAQPASEPPQAPSAPEADSEPQHLIRTAATATPEWLAARNAFYNHLMACRACYAPTGNYCPAGAELRAIYDSTPMEPTL